jgi:hypothetical protein
MCVPFIRINVSCRAERTPSVGLTRSLLSTVTNLILLGRTWVIWQRNQVWPGWLTALSVIDLGLIVHRCIHGGRPRSCDGVCVRISLRTATSGQGRCLHGTLRVDFARPEMALRPREHGEPPNRMAAAVAYPALSVAIRHHCLLAVHHASDP